MRGEFFSVWLKIWWKIMEVVAHQEVAPVNTARTIEMRDMVAMSILLAGFTPYLTDQLNADTVYRG